MINRITTAIAAAAIAMTSAAPVHADNNDVLKLAIGALGVGLLVHELDKKNRKEIENASGDEWENWAHDDRWRHDRKYFGHRQRGRIIPAQCIFDGKIRGRWREVVSPYCMREFGADRRLPRECRVEVKSRGQRHQAYGLHCLEKNGYRVARWRR
ncbi:hypothetical protein OEW28_02790 [Defluviimonas sp. WL0002]|uniref:Uncharacterized protein n=1 Tax=Albidovulum marisflavi TaxID=2984159 RepID=A0ABT2Z8X6_9RHOB|nr:hypothetical protein [Defluviimonas sp. WL0002]MCV2867551.1 hypothetical protein [Defluviimonas sp. WL0002]